MSENEFLAVVVSMAVSTITVMGMILTHNNSFRIRDWFIRERPVTPSDDEQYAEFLETYEAYSDDTDPGGPLGVGIMSYKIPSDLNSGMYAECTFKLEATGIEYDNGKIEVNVLEIISFIGSDTDYALNYCKKNLNVCLKLMLVGRMLMWSKLSTTTH